jgi:hypothetical protein
MTTWQPIAKTVTQYVDTSGNPYSGAVLKAYLAGTTTVTNIATSSSGSTTVTSVALNASGYPAVSGNVVIPHISADYKLSLYPTQVSADANSGALWTIDNIARDFAGVASLPSATMAKADQVVGYQSGTVKRLTVYLNSLYDTEENIEFTPTLYGGTTAGTTTYTGQKGYYFKAGGLVTCVFTLGWSSFTGTGGVFIGGMPFTSANLSDNPKFGLTIGFYTGFILSGENLGGNMLVNTNYIRLTRSANASNTLEHDKLGSSGEIQASISYIV